MSKSEQQKFYRSLLGDDFRESIFPIDGNKIPVATGSANITDLHYWVDNPRVYDEVHGSGKDPDEISTEYIYKKLSRYKDCISLKSKIFKDGGQREPVVVAKDITGNTDNFVVYEGNTRLASLTALFKDGEKGNWSTIEVRLFNLDGFDPELIVTYIGDVHLQDEKNKWATHKGARYYYRLVNDLIADDYERDDAFKKVASKFSSKITKGSVERNYEIIEFMEKRKMGVLEQEAQYGYWVEFFQSAKNKDVRDFFNDAANLENKVKNPKADAYDNRIVEEISKGAITSITQGSGSFRSLIRKVSEFYDKDEDKGAELIYKFIDGDISLSDAAKLADEGGASDRSYKMIKDFHRKLFNSDRKTLRAAVLKHENLLELVKDIEGELKTTHKDLMEEYIRSKNRRKKK